jgi:hypothetical protein
MTRRRLLAAAFMSLMATAVACQSASSLPDEYLGRWYFMGSSGGIDGDGTGEPATGSIVITANNEIERYRADGNRYATEPFEPTRDESIFSGGQAWVLVGSNGPPRVIAIYENGTMSLSENVYDGFSYAYQRTPRAGL